jgi:hypothetical protein
MSHRPGFVRHHYNDVTQPRNVTQMDERDFLGQRFEENRAYLRAVASSRSEVQYRSAVWMKVHE